MVYHVITLYMDGLSCNNMDGQSCNNMDGLGLAQNWANAGLVIVPVYCKTCLLFSIISICSLLDRENSLV